MTSQNNSILIVDDFATLRMSLKSILERLNFTDIEEAEDGLQAVEKLNRRTYSLIITDIDMPHMNGFELLDHIKKDNRLKDIPVIFITAEAEKEKIVRAIESGLDAYITKPFTIATLKQKIKDVLDSEI